MLPTRRAIRPPGASATLVAPSGVSATARTGKVANDHRADWREALRLALVGNIVYYLFLASAIQRAGSPLPTMIIGTLPVVIAVTSNLRDHARDGRLPWARLAPSLVLIGAGIALVNRAELDRLAADSGELVRLAVVDGDALTFVAKAQGARHGLRYDPDQGIDARLSCTSSGHAWLSTLPEDRGDYLIAARAACSLPCLRKDFLVDAWQVYDVFAIGQASAKSRGRVVISQEGKAFRRPGYHARHILFPG